MQKGTLAFDFQMHFVDAIGKENDPWWGKSFSKLKKDELTEGRKDEIGTEFKELADVDALKTKCITTYAQKIKDEIHIKAKLVQHQFKWWIF